MIVSAVRIPLIPVVAFVTTVLASIAPLFGQLVVGTNGNDITWRAGGGYCCVGASLDEPFTVGADCSVVSDCSTVPQKSGVFTCNPVGTHTVSACWYSAGVPWQCDSQTVEVTQQADPSCPFFDLIAGPRVLTHKFGSADAYPFGQSADAQTTLKLRARRAPGGTTIYLRVYDPPNSAAYGTPHQSNDNNDSAAGTFSGSPTTQVTLPTAGKVSVVVSTTDHAAGDNYEIRAAADATILTDPNFPCDTDCQGATLTAWKRAYLETDRMFRKGAMLTQNAAAGDTVISVSSVADFTSRKGSTPGSRVMLVHGPRNGQPGYFEPGASDPAITVESINKSALTLTLSRPIGKPYQKADSPTQPWLADGVGVISGVESTDYFVPNASLLSSLFASAFVELASDPAAGECNCLPLYKNLSTTAVTEMATRWFDHTGLPNRFQVIGGSQSGTDLGVRIAPSRTGWVWIANIETYRRIDRTNLNAEAASHEFAHTWDVNYQLPTKPHCDKNDYTNSALKCLMQAVWTDASGAVLPEYYDGHVAFHYDVMAPGISEYLEIARHLEPLQ